MDLSWISTALSGVLGGGVLVKFWEQRRQRQDKLDERRERHNEHVRQAHAQLIASYLKLLAVCEELNAATMTKLNHEDPDDPPSPNDLSADEYRQLCEDHRQLMKSFSIAAMETDARIIEALLLDNRLEIQARLQSLLNKPLPRQAVYTVEFESMIASHREELDALIQLLSDEVKKGALASGVTGSAALPPGK